MKRYASVDGGDAVPASVDASIRFSGNAFGALLPELQRAVHAEGYETPTAIQEQAIPPLLDGRDVLGTAQTGTGKTAAFALPLLQRLTRANADSPSGSPRALILAPTRELAAQIGDSIRVYGRFLQLRHTVIYGGVGQHPQVKALRRGVDILVATPGRLLDLMGQGHVRLESVEVFILDEVDRMLDMGFINDIKRVLAVIPRQRQTLFFSATMARKMEELAHSMVRQPVRITITPNQPTVEQVEQKVLFVNKHDKSQLLTSLLGRSGVRKSLVFTQMKSTANRVVKQLSAAGIQSAAIHGNKSQSSRTKALDGFRRGRFSVLVATDVAARGLDVDDITHVINYDLPVEAETYVHRIGRTARAGAAGDAISLCCAEDRAYLRAIEALLREAVPVEMEHDYHSDAALRSTLPPPKLGGGGNRKGSGGRGRRSSPNRVRGGRSRDRRSRQGRNALAGTN